MLFEFAGPPSSGKTTVLKYLKKRFSGRLKIYEEINPYTFFKDHKGGAYVDFELEVRIIKADLARTREIVASGEPALVETGVFHLAYLKRFAEKEGTKEARELYSKFEKEYLELFSSVRHLVIFIDTKPEVSWIRRRAYYRQRVEKIIKEKGGKVRKLMRKYKDNLFELYGYFKGLYESLPLQKVRLKNNYRKEERFLMEVERIVVTHLDND